MKKSKVRVDARDTTRSVLRDEDGIMRNFSYAATQAEKLKVTRIPDILKPVERYTYVCLVCREFSKHTGSCPSCKRDMFNFGISVKKVKKGSKKNWKLFIEAYSYLIYNIGKEILPEPIIEEKMRIGNSIRRRSKHECAQDTISELLREWVHKFDKFLDAYRK